MTLDDKWLFSDQLPQQRPLLQMTSARCIFRGEASKGRAECTTGSGLRRLPMLQWWRRRSKSYLWPANGLSAHRTRPEASIFYAESKKTWHFLECRWCQRHRLIHLQPKNERLEEWALRRWCFHNIGAQPVKMDRMLWVLKARHLASHDVVCYLVIQTSRFGFAVFYHFLVFFRKNWQQNIFRSR